MLEFQEEGHIYTYAGTVVPSVTQVLNEWVKVKLGHYSYYVSTVDGTIVNAKTFEEAGDFGTAVHKAVKLFIDDKLDWSYLDEALFAPLGQFEQWMKDKGITREDIKGSEHRLFSKKLMIAGTDDLEVMMKNLTIIDIKTGTLGLVGPQVAGYELLYREEMKYRKLIDRFVLHLPRDGSDYTFKPLKNRQDKAFFLNRHYQYNYLRG